MIRFDAIVTDAFSSPIELPLLLDSSLELACFFFGKLTTRGVLFVTTGDLNDACCFRDFLVLQALGGEEAVAIGCIS